MTYRRRASPLHAARAAVACLWCAALVTAALCFDHPVVLAGVLAAALGGALGARVGRDVLRFTLLVGVPLALFITLVNALISREGLTVVWRFGDVPLITDGVTLEAIVYGGVLGLRALAVIAACALYFTAVDPDEVLRLFRRFGFRSALTATLATRMVGVLAADGRRLAEGQRCRPGEPASRLALVRAVTSGALDRATDVAAALEVRGYGAARRAPRGGRRPWSRHDVAFLVSALAMLALAVGGAATHAATLDAGAALELTGGMGPLLLAGAILVVALAPFADRRGIAR